MQAIADSPGCTLRAPTSDAGLAPFCKDTFAGKLKLQLWERTRAGRGKVCVSLVPSLLSNRSDLRFLGSCRLVSCQFDDQYKGHITPELEGQ